MKTKEFLGGFARGSALGLGMIPGVSAGTMAVIVGIYDKLIDSIANLRKDFKNSWRVLWPLLLGIIISSIVVLIGVTYGYDYAPFAISCLFAGLVIGSLPTITKEIKGHPLTWKSYLLIVIGFIVAAGIGVLSAFSKLSWNINFEQDFIDGKWWTYICCLLAGFVAAVACVIPGISGAMILYIFGLYSPCVSIYVGEQSMLHNHARIGSGLGLTFCVIVGAVLGIVLVAKAMKKLLETKRVETFDVVLGFVLGSIVSMFINQSVIKTVNGVNTWIYTTTPIWEWIVGPVLLIAFAILFFWLTNKTNKTKTDQLTD